METSEVPAQDDELVDDPAGEADDLEEAADESGSELAEMAATVEALLMASDKPLLAKKISDLGELGGVRTVRKAVDALNERYEREGASFRIVDIAGGYQVQTLPEYNDVISRLVAARKESRLSQAALETLAIVAYRQPVLRADVEAIRGVACGEVLRGLMERNLVRIAGRAQEIGRPLLYGTPRHFLEVFGLSGLEDLPNAEQLRMPASHASDGREPPAGQAEQTPPDDAPGQADSPAPTEADEAPASPDATATPA